MVDLSPLRKAQGLGTVEMAKQVGLSRMTLSAVEAGDPGPSIGTYLRVMSVLGVSGELALLAGDTMQPAPAGSAAAKSRRPRPVVQVLVSAGAGTAPGFPAGHRAARVLFVVNGNTMVLLHGFIKKSPKTPKPDLDLAKERLKRLKGLK